MITNMIIVFFCLLHVFVFLVSDILDYSNVIFPTDSSGSSFLPPVLKPKGTINCTNKTNKSLQKNYNNIKV